MKLCNLLGALLSSQESRRLRRQEKRQQKGGQSDRALLSQFNASAGGWVTVNPNTGKQELLVPLSDGAAATGELVTRKGQGFKVRPGTQATPQPIPTIPPQGEPRPVAYLFFTRTVDSEVTTLMWPDKGMPVRPVGSEVPGAEVAAESTYGNALFVGQSAPAQEPDPAELIGPNDPFASTTDSVAAIFQFQDLSLKLIDFEDSASNSLGLTLDQTLSPLNSQNDVEWDYEFGYRIDITETRQYFLWVSGTVIHEGASTMPDTEEQDISLAASIVEISEFDNPIQGGTREFFNVRWECQNTSNLSGGFTSNDPATIEFYPGWSHGGNLTQSGGSSGPYFSDDNLRFRFFATNEEFAIASVLVEAGKRYQVGFAFSGEIGHGKVTFQNLEVHVTPAPGLDRFYFGYSDYPYLFAMESVPTRRATYLEGDPNVQSEAVFTGTNNLSVEIQEFQFRNGDISAFTPPTYDWRAPEEQLFVTPNYSLNTDPCLQVLGPDQSSNIHNALVYRCDLDQAVDGTTLRERIKGQYQPPPNDVLPDETLIPVVFTEHTYGADPGDPTQCLLTATGNTFTVRMPPLNIVGRRGSGTAGNFIETTDPPEAHELIAIIFRPGRIGR